MERGIGKIGGRFFLSPSDSDELWDRDLGDGGEHDGTNSQQQAPAIRFQRRHSEIF